MSQDLEGTRICHWRRRKEGEAYRQRDTLTEKNKALGNESIRHVRGVGWMWGTKWT